MSVSGQKSAPASQRRGLAFAAIPLVVFAGLVALFYFGLVRGDPQRLPSVLIGREAPNAELPALDGLLASRVPVPGIAAGDLARGQVTIVNIWASWCGPCRQEHPTLIALSRRDDIRVVGINYKDNDVNARRFLGQLGNPYDAVGVDTTGRIAVDWGLTGVPETFIVDGEGIIRYKHIGPILPGASYEESFLPALNAVLAAGGGGDAG